MQKQTKEEKEQEFIEAVEQILGFHVMEWQKPLLLEVRQAHMAGRPIQLERSRILQARGIGRPADG